MSSFTQYYPLYKVPDSIKKQYPIGLTVTVKSNEAAFWKKDEVATIVEYGSVIKDVYLLWMENSNKCKPILSDQVMRAILSEDFDLE